MNELMLIKTSLNAVLVCFFFLLFGIYEFFYKKIRKAQLFKNINVK